MTQYDAGPGDWSDRPWEDPERKSRPQARRRRVTLPPWALLAILVAIIILLCVGVVLIVRAVRQGDGDGTLTPSPTFTVQASPSATVSLLEPTSAISPTATVILSISTPPVTAVPTEIRPGVLVVVTGTGGTGLRLRASASTSADMLALAREGTVLTVLEGPEEANGYTWWKVRTPEGDDGWGAANWLVLKTEE